MDDAICNLLHNVPNLVGFDGRRGVSDNMGEPVTDLIG